MRKLWMLAGSAALMGILVAGCAKDVEPEAATPEPTTSNTDKPEPPALEPLKEAPEDGDDVAVLETEKGRIVVMFYPDRAPKTVENFKSLVSSGFYDGTRFHRCISGFMVQGGDPKSKDMALSAEWGTGGQVENGQDKNIMAEFNDIKHVRGVLSMARGQDPNSASSQFFIMHAVAPSLDGQYTAFGKVVEGMEVVDEIVKTGSPNPNDNGKVEPKEAIVLKSAKMATWPIEGAK